MRVFRRTRLLAGLALLALVTAASGCEYYPMAVKAAQEGQPVPWFCNPTAPNSVTGPGMGTVNWYAGVTRAPLSAQDCATFGAHLDLAKAYAEQFPTLGSAEASGFSKGFAFIPGMGTHHGFENLTPAELLDPSFDRFNPIIPGSPIDGAFDPNRPEFLQYNGNTADSVLVGMSWYVRTTTGLPPAGFAGNNDWWHHHPTLCLSKTTAEVVGVNTNDDQCALRNAVNVYMDDYYMLHAWVVDDLEYHADVHAPMHPCIKSTGAIFDMDDPCHTSATAGASTSARAAETSSDSSSVLGFCPLYQIEEQWAATEGATATS
jgi:hypothetical protein